MTMQKRHIMRCAATAVVAGSLAMAGCTTTTNEPQTQATAASRRQVIDDRADATMSRLYETVPDSRELIDKARGVLVFPSVVQAGAGVGGQRGDGALRVAGSSVGYYTTTSGSIGAQFGAQSKAIIILFMTQESLDKFVNSDGWSLGGDASIALVKVGANGAVDTTTAPKPVEVFVLTNSGLMGDLSLEGTKITRRGI
jgi:lipid-binding SYLF domain-containing protein